VTIELGMDHHEAKIATLESCKLHQVPIWYLIDLSSFCVALSTKRILTFCSTVAPATASVMTLNIL
jgi:hypothetical protein